MRIYIPLGIDCGIAQYLINNNLRLYSLPFDWTVTYNGVYDIIKNKFSNFLPTYNNSIFSDTAFIHNKFPNDYETMNRRINRFMELLNNENDEFIFIRKGHMHHHHKETQINKYNLKNDLNDCNELYYYFKQNYPNLKFKIIVILCCHECFDCNNIYINNNIEIYNISHETDTKQKDEDIKNIIDKIVL